MRSATRCVRVEVRVPRAHATRGPTGVGVKEDGLEGVSPGGGGALKALRN